MVDFPGGNNEGIFGKDASVLGVGANSTLQTFNGIAIDSFGIGDFAGEIASGISGGPNLLGSNKRSK